MIQPRQDLAWVEGADGRLTPFDEARLIASIQTAVRCAGHDSELLPESVAGAIHLYAHDRQIPASEIEAIVLSVLHMLGCEDVASAYAERRQLAEIHLNELAAQSGPGFELDFYWHLDAALGSAAEGRLALLQVRGLRSCVMQLRAAHRWGASCRALAEDIVEHVRFRVARLRPPHAAALRLAVVD
jgi:hypothetical protein